MGWRIAKPTEIVDGTDQAIAEQVAPEPIDRHPPSERVVGSGDRISQTQPHQAGFRRIRLVVERGQKAPSDHLSAGLVVAAD